MRSPGEAEDDGEGEGDGDGDGESEDDGETETDGEAETDSEGDEDGSVRCDPPIMTFRDGMELAKEGRKEGTFSWGTTLEVLLACVIPFQSPPLTLLATSTTAGAPVWFTEFRPTAGLTYVDGVVTPTDVQGDAQVQLVAQFAATDTASPSAPVAVGSATASRGKVYADLSTQASSNAFYRLGLRPVLSTPGASAPIAARVSGWLRSCGVVIGREEVQVGPMPANTPRVAAVSGLFPARQFSTVSALLKVVGKASASSGSVKTRLMARVFESDASEAEAWTALESYDTVSAANAERFVSSVSPGLTPNTNMWGQLGVAIETTTNDVTATVMVLTMGAS